jgi:hypothetical protein
MKQILLIIALMIVASRGFAGEFLNEQQRTVAISEIDSICADTWCGGDFGFTFHQISCDDESSSCNVSFDLHYAEYDYDTDEYGDSQTFKTVCTLGSISSYDDIVETHSRSNYVSLNWDFYSRLTDCIGEREETFRENLAF